MTAQEMPKIRVKDTLWTLYPAQGLSLSTPKSSVLGFRTQPRHTANWEGRLNYFSVRDGDLLLEKVKVSLRPEYKDFMPELDVGWREDRHRKYWSKGYGAGGIPLPPELREEVITYVYFHEMKIAYSGELIACREFSHLAYAGGGYQSPGKFEKRLHLHFENGQLLPDRMQYSNGVYDVNAKGYRGLVWD